MKTVLKLITILALQILLLNAAHAVSINSVFVDSVSPGGEGVIRVNIENDGNNDLDVLSFSLNFQNTQIIPLGSSEAFLNELRENDDETFAFRFKVANDLPAGTYSIPYTITYEENNERHNQSGIIGVIVSAEPDLQILIDSSSAVIGQPSELRLRIVNKGLADARFVSLFIESEDLTFTSESSEYIGTIDSDDFETSSFDVIYNNKFPVINARLTYKDFNNVDQSITESISLRAYTRDEAIEKGILTRSNATIYVSIVAILIIIWILYRIIRKRRKKNKE